MPLDDQVADAARRITEPCQSILIAVQDLPVDLQICAIGSVLTHILRDLSENKQAEEVCEFIRILLTSLNSLSEDDE